MPALKAAVASAQRSGELGRGRVSELARAVLRRELMAARGAELGERVDEIQGCLDAAEPALSERAGEGDDAAAEARLVLVDRGALDADEASVDDPRAEQRALAARAATGKKDSELRTRAMLDGDERVRRAALAAAREAADPNDVEALLDAARRDPDPQARRRAVLALGALGGPRAVLGLADRWVIADEDLRTAIVAAWSLPASYATGGEGQLVRAAELSYGPPSIEAALVLARRGSGPAGLAAGVLLRALREGSLEERRLVLRRVPWATFGAADAIREASRSGPDEVRVVALARLLDGPGTRAEALEPLRELSRSRNARVATQARAALAAGGDASVKPLLEADLKSPWSGQRQMAAFGLIRLGELDAAASALADDSPSVRTRVACRVLATR